MTSRPNTSGIGRQVHALRTTRHWSMRELASRLGVSAATVSAIESGKTGVSVDRLGELAEVFDVPVTTVLAPARTADAATGAERNWRTFGSLNGDPAMSAAIGAFVEAGYHGSSMRTIAERAGMSQASIYHYYPSKQSLLVRILDLAMDELDWRVAAAEGPVGAPLDKLYRMVESLALFHTLRSDLAYIGASEMRSLEEPERSRISLRRTAIQHLVDREILRAVRDGSAHCERPRETGRAIVTMCTALPQWYDVAGPTPPEAIAKDYAELALRMIGANPDFLNRMQAARAALTAKGHVT
jgi:AcrR family transcriptional regulator/transcriptional regulator with XRE-family HTH domain